MPPPPPSPAHRLSLLLVWFPPAGPSVVLEAAASQPHAGLAFRSSLGGEEDEDGAPAALIEDPHDSIKGGHRISGRPPARSGAR
ncbi:hypothetical protein NDU88_002860 [Pleurodeles waltl]|uniref:Secreted protein n=1 Tax=Pleurodeles waltl TaxID=8319 RepID=A0AAV7VFT3_PLEWA|nr:hypothetical protein NDU88_002860 [Pleurodeles waltl]